MHFLGMTPNILNIYTLEKTLEDFGYILKSSFNFFRLQNETMKKAHLQIDEFSKL
jgi:hypothetical protein